jgi:hypothetical protein
VAVVAGGTLAFGQAAVAPTNDLPNPYQTIESHAKLPEGRTWGSTSAVDIDPDGKSIWVAERCGTNSCLDRATGQMNQAPSVLKFDESGKLVRSFGQGLLIFPHGIHVDREGNVWVTDGQDDAPTPARGGGAAAGGAAAAGAAAGQGAARGPAPAPRSAPLPGSTRGHQVFKFSPEGKVLLALGKPGGAGEPDYFYQPNDVHTAPNGDIFVSEGHGGGNGRILKFDRTGKFIKQWGKRGTGPSEFDQPHSLAIDSRNRLFVADRANNRIQIFDLEGKFLEEWRQFSRNSGIFIDKNDMLYAADSESNNSRKHGEWKRGIRIGSAKDGKVIAFIPDPADANNGPMAGTSAAEGVAADAAGNIFGAEVGPRALKKYVRK